MNTQFRVTKGIEIVDGNVSIFYGKGDPSSTNPQPFNKLANGDLYHDTNTQKLYKFNGTSWVLTGVINRLGDGLFDGFYVTNVDENGNNTFTKAIKDLDAAIKTNADQIQTLISGANPQGFVFAITSDSTNFGNAVAGPVPQAVTPSDADDAFSPSANDVMFHVDGTKWVFNGAAWVKDTNFVNAEKDMWAIKHDLTNRSGQELTALYIYTTNGFVKFGEVTNDIATAIGLGAGYAAEKGIVSSADTVQQALQKIDGNVGTRVYSAPKNVTNGDSVSEQIEDIDTAIGSRTYTSQFEITNNESVASSLDALDKAIGDRASYATYPKIVSNNDSLAVAIGKLDQAAGFAINEQSSSGAITASTTLRNIKNAIAIKWYVTIVETPTSGTGAVYASEIIAIYKGGGSSEDDIDYTEYGVVQIGSFDAAPSITLGYSGSNVNIAVTASKAGSVVNISVKGMILGEFANQA